MLLRDFRLKTLSHPIHMTHENMKNQKTEEFKFTFSYNLLTEVAHLFKVYLEVSLLSTVALLFSSVNILGLLSLETVIRRRLNK